MQRLSIALSHLHKKSIRWFSVKDISQNNIIMLTHDQIFLTTTQDICIYSIALGHTKNESTLTRAYRSYGNI